MIRAFAPGIGLFGVTFQWEAHFEYLQCAVFPEFPQIIEPRAVLRHGRNQGTRMRPLFGLDSESRARLAGRLSGGALALAQSRSGPGTGAAAAAAGRQTKATQPRPIDHCPRWHVWAHAELAAAAKARHWQGQVRSGQT